MSSDERIIRLEESLGFAERRNEELTEQVLVLSRKVEELLRKIGAMESRLGEIARSKAVRSEEADRSQADDDTMNY